jgi:hypothetical protein
MSVMNVETDIITSMAASPAMVLCISRPSNQTLLFLLVKCHNVCDITLTNNVQYQSQLIDTNNITLRSKAKCSDKEEDLSVLKYYYK